MALHCSAFCPIDPAAMQHGARAPEGSPDCNQSACRDRFGASAPLIRNDPHAAPYCDLLSCDGASVPPRLVRRFGRNVLVCWQGTSGPGSNSRWECRACPGRLDASDNSTRQSVPIMEDSAILLDKWLPIMRSITSCKNGVSSSDIAGALRQTTRANSCSDFSVRQV